MKKLIVSLILFAVIGAADLIFTYNRYNSVFGYMKMQKADEESSNIYEQEYERPEREPKLPEPSSDYVNKIDSEKYFANKKGMRRPDTDEYLVSHNVFDNNDGSTVTVDITSVFYENGVYSGRMYSYIRNDMHGGVQTPCAYNSDKRSALSYTYNGNFSLLLDDYNNDGNPDYLIRTGDPEGGGAYYYIEYSVNEAYPCHHTNFSTPKSNSDSAVFIYGRTADSIRLDHTDVDHFFFLTKSGSEVVPYMYNSKFQKCDFSDYAVEDRLYSAFYENGVITLRATDCREDMKIYEDAVSVTIRKYNDRVWSKCGEFTAQFDPKKDYCRFVHSAKYEQSLENGLYQLEINTPSGIAYAEFRATGGN